MRIKSRYAKKAQLPSTAGFTLLEIIIVGVVFGIIIAIAAPSWLRLIAHLHLNSAQDQIYRSLQSAKSQAKLQKVTWQFSIQQTNNIVQWAVHPASINPANAQWKSLDKMVVLDAETTLQKFRGVRQMQFDYKGNVTKPPFGRVTLSSKYGGKIKRCVFVSTLIGTLRTAKEHSKPKDGKYCY